MKLHRHALSALVLFVGGALLAPVVSPAEGGTILKKFNKEIGEKNDVVSYRVIVDNDPNNEVAEVELSVSSDAGNEDLVLTESDAWLHGGAALSALPVKDAALTLTLYDKGSASLMTFSGTLATDGTVTLAADEEIVVTGDCASKLGCGTTVKESPDVEVLAAEVYPSGKGYALTLDLAGADTYEVAYATIVVSGGDKAEVDWEAVGSVWEAETTLEHSGAIDAKAQILDASGETIENVKAELAEPWLDDGDGVNVLSAGSGTGVAVTNGRFTTNGFPRWRHFRMTVVSSGWTNTEYPTHAELELAGGETVTVKANSYQRTYTGKKLSFEGGNPIGLTYTLRVGGVDIVNVSGDELASPVCSEGVCATLMEDTDGDYRLSFTTYGEDPSKLPEELEYQAYSSKGVVVDELIDDVVAEERLSSDTDTLTAVFASELEIDGDPNGGDASGAVSLLGAADTKGKQATLSKGTFFGSFSHDSDGDLGLGGYGTDDWATSDTSNNVVLGEAVALTDREGNPLPPPAIQYGNGSGTKNASSQTSTRPELL